jgi:predicted acylesterase/phospholipase RssA
MHLRSIALGGGGSRGLLHVGALQAIRQVKGDLHFPEGIYGSSIGAVFATAVAFGVPLEDIRRVTETSMTFSRVIPQPTLDHILTLPARKGLFPMTAFESTVLSAFQEIGLDLRGKRCRDAKVPLYIVVSDMTTHRSTLLTGDVPVLDALRCSACIPVLFEPQVLYGHVYLDGGVLNRCLGTLVPKDTLVVHVGSDWPDPVTPQSSLQELLWGCYAGREESYRGANVCRFKGIKISPLGELIQEDRDALIREGLSQMNAFLAAQKLEDPRLRDPT